MILSFNCLILLFGTEVDSDGNSVEVPEFAHPVFDESFIGVADVLG